VPRGKVDRAALVAAVLAGDPAAAAAVPPASPRERDLLGLWRELLDAPVAGVDDDFFERGGHSLLAARLVARARDELGLALTLPMVFRHPTIRGLAAAIGSGRPPQGGAEMIPLQASGTRAPVYCICGVQLYQRLATAVGPDIPVLGVFIPWEERILDPTNEGAPALPVEALARAYLDAIDAHQPEGTFSLVGFSFGGILAYEVARLARAAGRTVSMTVILDMPTVEARRRASASRLLRRTLRPVLGWLASLPGRSGTAGNLAQTSEDRREALYDVAMAGYQTPRTEGPLVVIRRSGRGCPDADPGRSLGWDEYCPDVRCVEVPAADHLEVLAAGAVPTIAQRLRAWLP
jgi:thioesterase domain-containing protein